MYKLIFISLQFAIIVIIASWAVNNSYTISIAYKEYIISTSSSYLLAFLFFVFLLIIFIQSSYFRVKNKLINYRNNKFIKNKEKGYDSFTKGMISLANKDFKSVLIENKKVSKYLKDSTLHLLLKSETLKIQKNYDDLQQIYEKMILNDKTKILGLRGLMEQYLRNQDYHHALIYGEKLFKISPYIEKIYDTLINIIGKTNNWHNLIKINEKAISLKIISKKTFSINKSIALYEIAKIKHHNDKKESMNLMAKALDLRKNFPPYVAFYIDLLIENGKANFAKKFVTKVWNDSPHPDYKIQIKNLSTKLGINFDRLVEDITYKSKENEESKKLIAESLISEEKWNEARKSLSELLEHKPEKEVCLLMSEIEKGDSNDKQKVDAWLSRANFGEMSNLWICGITNVSQQQWTSVSNSGYFNSLEWKKPSMIDVSQKLSLKNNKIDYNS